MSDDLSSAAGAQPEKVSPPQNRTRKRRRKRTRKGRGENIFAALDLGTNNCRLLVAKPAGEHFRVIDSYSRVVRLGSGLSTTGRLSDESMSAAIEAIGVCASKMKSKKVTRWRCVATQACRQAALKSFLRVLKRACRLWGV